LMVVTGGPDIFATLLGAGAVVDVRDDEGYTALMRSAWHGHAETVTVLLDGGADLDAVGKDGKRALDLAANEPTRAVLLAAASAASAAVESAPKAPSQTRGMQP